MFSVLVIRLRSLRLLRVSGIVMRLRMFLLLITFLKASHSFRNRLLVICKNAYLFRSEERFSRNAETDLVCRLLLEKKKAAAWGWVWGSGAPSWGRGADNSGWPSASFDSGQFFFFNDTATTEIYTLSLHDALPI